MGESAAQTVEEIEVLRDRLDGEVQEFQERLPAPAVWTKRLVGVAVGGGMAGSVFWFAVRRIRSSNSSESTPEAMQTVIQLLPDRLSGDLEKRVSAVVEEGSWRPWAMAVAGAWLLFRMAELRQLRRMNMALVRR
jgi:hypothetical protein